MNFELYREWFESLRGLILDDLKSIENKSFIETKWNHSQKGGGLMTKIKGDGRWGIFRKYEKSNSRS